MLVQTILKKLVQRSRLPRLAFPDCQHLPAVLLQRLNFSLISRDGSSPLLRPELGTCCRRDATIPAVMRMPEATMNEDDGPVLREDDIGCAREVFAMQSEAIAEGMKSGPHNDFGLCILAAYRGHILTSLLWCVNVCHAPLAASSGVCSVPNLS